MPIEFTHEDHARSPWRDQERIEKLAAAARDAISAFSDAMEDELVDAARAGDDPRLAIIAWMYGSATALGTDIDLTFGL